jgi:hypothetical protein
VCRNISRPPKILESLLSHYKSLLDPCVLRVMLSPGETPGATVNLREGDRGERVQGSRGNPGDWRRSEVRDLWDLGFSSCAVPSYSPVPIYQMPRRGSKWQSQTEVRQSEIRGGKRDIRAADPAALKDLYTGALIVSVCTIAMGVSVDCRVICRIVEFGLL